MKALAAALLFLFVQHSIQAEKLPDYQIKGTSIDKNLKASESVFDLTFTYAHYDYSGGKTKPLGPGKINTPIRLSYNGTEKTVTPDKNGVCELKLKPGKYLFQFFYNSSFSEVTTDSIQVNSRERMKVDVYFRESQFMVKPAKPVIYLYPTEPTMVQVSMEMKGEFTFTYPAYGNGWKVKAYPDGTLEQDGKTYNYLFWEGDMLLATALNEGFVKTNAELTAFFEEKLAHLGLNSKEIQDYVTYWVPRMQGTGKAKHFIRFVINQDYDAYAHLTVSPQPDQMIRVLMAWCPLEEDQPINIAEQQLPSFQRHGFTLVEWGGTEIKNSH